MSATSVPCSKCGNVIPPDAPQGLCPRCLLQQISMPTDGGPERPRPPELSELRLAFPHLEILELIGQGGMGFVYKARQQKLDRIVALKILPQWMVYDPAFAERFVHEGRVLARLNHPNIVMVHDFGQSGSFFFLLMEYVDGVNLRQAMRAGFSPDQALSVVPKICEALQFAHGEAILHRDIKPENILLDKKGRVKIADFGVAKLLGDRTGSGLTVSGATLGTPLYMAPEQIERPNAVDHRADIYSLGVVFYEMLTGELPLGRFAAPSEKSRTDPRLDDVVLRALEKEPGRRPQNAGDIKTQVENISNQPNLPPPLSKPLSSVQCYCSTPEHLRTFVGQISPYIGEGTLGLDAESLIFAQPGENKSISLASIKELGVGHFPRSAKLAQLDYIHVRFDREGRSEAILFTPHHGKFRPVWQTNKVVQDWFEAIALAVAKVTGVRPAPIADAHRRIQANSIFAKAAALLFIPSCIGLAIGLTMCSLISLRTGGLRVSALVVFFFAGLFLTLFGSCVWAGICSLRQRATRHIAWIFFIFAFALLNAALLSMQLRRRVTPADYRSELANLVPEATAPLLAPALRMIQLRHLSPSEAEERLGPFLARGVNVVASGFNRVSITATGDDLGKAATLLFVNDWPSPIPNEPREPISAARAFMQACALYRPEDPGTEQAVHVMFSILLKEVASSKGLTAGQIAEGFARYIPTQMRADAEPAPDGDGKRRGSVTCIFDDVPGLHTFSFVEETDHSSSRSGVRWKLDSLPPLLDAAFK